MPAGEDGQPWFMWTISFVQVAVLVGMIIFNGGFERPAINYMLVGAHPTRHHDVQPRLPNRVPPCPGPFGPNAAVLGGSLRAMHAARHGGGEPVHQHVLGQRYARPGGCGSRLGVRLTPLRPTQ